METLNQTSNFRYNSADSEGEIGFSGILEIFVHHARNIHNICIYDNQDVYAKFSLTYNPDETISTRVIIGGGKNPEFNEKLELKVNQIDAVLKCEIWMLSRDRNLLEDQLLGFALVPISLVSNQGGKLTCQDFSLTSTDLFHSPAGTVQLSVSLNCTASSSVSSPLFSSANPFSNISGNSSITSEVVLLDPNEFSRVEFPDINAATEDQMMVSEYFNLNAKSNCHQQASFLHLLQTRVGDYEMVGNSLEENENSLNGSYQNSGAFSSTTTSLSDDRNTADSNSIDRRSRSSAAGDQALPPLADAGMKQRKADDDAPGDVGGSGLGKGSVYGNMGRVFSGPVGSTDLEAEQAAMQQQIVDMYMKSMQQFTESLAKMKLPVSLDPNPDEENSGKVIRIVEKNSKLDMENKKEGSRVFYGSRAFF